MNLPCIKCKGKRLCGRDFCPIYAKNEAMFKSIDLLSKDFSSNSPPSVFIGRYSYPNINVGILAPAQEQKNIELYDAPHIWSKKNFTIKDIINFRSSLINSRFRQNIKNLNSKFLELSQELTMSAKPVDLEINLKKKPRTDFNFDQITLPMGPTAALKNFKITTNPKPSSSIEKVFYDTDLKSIGALEYLYRKNIDLNTLSKILSIGITGLKKNRKLVPTRWSITAADDTIGKLLIKQIKDFKEINEYYLFFGNYFGNYYLIFFFPNIWSYELFETYMPDSLYNPNQELQTVTDNEFYSGRKTYASNTVGGYYAARISILQKLFSLKRQASVLALRFVTNEYTAPLGVFVVREAAKKSLNNLMLFNTKEEMIKEAKEIIKTKFNYNISNLLKQSKLFHHIKTQTKLFRFL